MVLVRHFCYCSITSVCELVSVSTWLLALTHLYQEEPHTSQKCCFPYIFLNASEREREGERWWHTRPCTTSPEEEEETRPPAAASQEQAQ